MTRLAPVIVLCFSSLSCGGGTAKAAHPSEGTDADPPGGWWIITTTRSGEERFRDTAVKFDRKAITFIDPQGEVTVAAAEAGSLGNGRWVWHGESPDPLSLDKAGDKLRLRLPGKFDDELEPAPPPKAHDFDDIMERRAAVCTRAERCNRAIQSAFAERFPKLANQSGSISGDNPETCKMSQNALLQSFEATFKDTPVPEACKP